MYNDIYTNIQTRITTHRVPVHSNQTFKQLHPWIKQTQEIMNTLTISFQAQSSLHSLSFECHIENEVWTLNIKQFEITMALGRKLKIMLQQSSDPIESEGEWTYPLWSRRHKQPLQIANSLATTKQYLLPKLQQNFTTWITKNFSSHPPYPLNKLPKRCYSYSL